MKPPTMYLIPAPNLLNSAAPYRLPILFETKLLLPLLGLFIYCSMYVISCYILYIEFYKACERNQRLVVCLKLFITLPDRMRYQK